jgi:undecaprenyl-diphosphatase
MNPVHGVVLGIVQGLTEFLPISSSGHLVLVPWLLGWPEHSLTFDVALHMGTLAALLAFFWRDLVVLVAAWLPDRWREVRWRDVRWREVRWREVRWREVRLPDVRWRDVRWREVVSGVRAWLNERYGRLGIVPQAALAGSAPSGPAILDPVRRQQRRLGVGLLVASLPAALIGALFSDRIEAGFRSPVLIAILLVAGAVIMAAADRVGTKSLELKDVGLTQAVIVGVAQALALAPGVSRSGITLAAALFLGLNREAAARYVFLLGIPVTAGAGVFQLRHLLRDGIPVDERAAFALGVLSSLVVGILAIRFLLRYLRRHNLDVFVYYRIALAAFVLLVAAMRATPR